MILWRTRESAEDALWTVLDGGLGGAGLTSSLAHLDKTRPSFDLRQSALGFDTNAMLRLTKQRSSDAIDFLQLKHAGPLIVPTQTLIEMWNNTDAFWKDLSAEIAEPVKRLRAILDSATAVQDSDPISELVQDLEEGSWAGQDLPSTELPEELRLLLEVLQRRGTIGQVSRARFSALGHARFNAKIPPGFRDKQTLGDFFVWADFLAGLSSCDRDYPAVVFVTEDAKKDWYSARKAHPLLVAEVDELVSKPFYLLSVADFKRHVRDSS